MRTIRPSRQTSTKPQTGRARRPQRIVLAAAAAGIVALTGTAAPATASHRHDGDHHGHHHGTFKQINLVGDPGVTGVDVLPDSDVINPWGIAFGPTTPLWTSNQGSNTSTLFTGTNRANVAKLPLVVKASSPTGIVFNSTKRFVVTQNGVTAPAKFIFAENVFPSENDSTASITAWHNGTSTVPGSQPKPHAFYSGLALVTKHHGDHGDHGEHGEHGKSGPRLLAADSAPGGNIDVYDANFKRIIPDRKHAFVDPKVDLTQTPAYNVAYLHHRVYVTYAPPFPGAPGTSTVSVFTADGKFRKELFSGDPLNGPWGMAIAPEHWGAFGGDLLVGNVFDGTIHAFNRSNGHLEGTLKGADHKALVNVGLWGLQFGNGVIGTHHSLVFAAGVGVTTSDVDTGYEHGLIGLIEPVSRHHD